MQKNKITLSVALAVLNEANNLSHCLDSIRGFADELIVVDGGSSDDTVDIAVSYGARVIKTDNPAIFHINKQKALDACKGAWILQLDADEVVTDQLRDEIIHAIEESPHEKGNERINGYFIPRKNYFLGKFLSKGGQYPDHVVRLVRRGYAKFPCKSVHEQIAITGKIGYLTHPLMHYSYRTKEEYWRKADVYTSLSAEEIKDQNRKPGARLWLFYFLWKPATTFLNIYIRHKGFMDGAKGFLFAWYSSLHFPIAYRKYCDLMRNSS